MNKTVLSLKDTTQTLKLLGDQTRLSIVGLLKDHECCVCEFVEVLNVSQPAISQLLRKLRDGGIVSEQRKGNWKFYSLNKNHETYSLTLDIIEHIPDQKEKIIELEQAGKRIVCN